MNNKIVIFFLVAILLIGGFFYFTKKSAPPPDPLADLIVVSEPKPNQTIDPGVPLLVVGKARGNWYFEGSFPAKIIDANGNILAELPMQADGEWTTPDFVPFRNEIHFEKPTTETGTLILRNDNPSGLPENSKELDIPLKFKI